MSSMWRFALFLPLAVVMATSGSAQNPPAYSSPAFTASVGNSLNDWRTLRRSGNYPFATYARFLIANPGWPDEAKMRGWAEAGDATRRECSHRDRLLRYRKTDQW